jgi:transcriptional regulator with XRE-family HTH domain
MKTNKLTKKYKASELADSFVFRSTLNDKQKTEGRTQLAKAREKVRKNITPGQKLLAGVLQLKYQMEDYGKSSIYDKNLSFAYFLRQYIKLKYTANKQFALDINIDETELSQLLNNHRSPSEKTIIRLEIHSNKTIPALSWYKLIEKEKEYELQNNTEVREKETKYVKNKLGV